MIGYAVTDLVAPATTVRPVPMDPGTQKRLSVLARAAERNQKGVWPWSAVMPDHWYERRAS